MRAVGVENANFKFKGVLNEDMGVKMLSMPIRPHPARKGKLVDIPGAHGKLFQDEGVYDRILVSLRCIAPDNDNIDAVSAWLSGEGDLIFGDEPDRAYHARITKEFSRSNRNPRLRGQEFTVTFDCEPFRYQSTPDAAISLPKSGHIPSSSKEVTKGTVPSAPLIKIVNNNEYAVNFGIDIGSYHMTVNINGNTTMRIDNDAKIAYKQAHEENSPVLLATQDIFGDWIYIEPGKRHIAQHTAGDGVNITIEPRWRWL